MTNRLHFKPGATLKFKYQYNAVFQLIIALGVCYILQQAITVILLVISDAPKALETTQILPAIGIGDWEQVLHRPWVVFTYFLGHSSFFQLLSNALWLYCFGIVIQSLIGHKEIMLLFFSSCVLAAIVYAGLGFLLQWPATSFYLSALPGVVALASAALTLQPKYRFYLGERFSFPLYILVGVFVLLGVSGIYIYPHIWILTLLSAAFGSIYILLLKAGYKPGRRLYSYGYKINNWWRPNENEVGWREGIFPELEKEEKKQKADEENVDRILDKISEHGIGSLTKTELKTLKDMREG